MEPVSAPAHRITGDDFSAPELTERLVAAASAGNLDAVRNILTEWEAMDEPIPERGDDEHPMYPLNPALAAAAGGTHLHVVSYLLENAFRPDDAAIRAAIGGASTGALDLFLQHGWDINKPERIGRPPPLS